MTTAVVSRRVSAVAWRELVPIAAVLLACSGGSGGEATGTAPVIASLNLEWPQSAVVNEGGGMVSATYLVDVVDANGDVTSVVATARDAAGAEVSRAPVSVENPPGATAGRLVGEALIPTTSAATYTIEVQAFDSRGAGSNVLSGTFAVVVGNPVPTIASLSPSTAPANGAGFVLSVTGTGFIAESRVSWDGVDLPTTFVDATTLAAQVDGYRLGYYYGTVQVRVTNPGPGGGTSAAATFLVTPPEPSPVPTLTSISPTSVEAGDPSFTLTVTGSGFVGSSRVLWNGSYRDTTCVDAGTLTAIISGYDVATAGTASVSVNTPGPGGGTSAAASFVITPPAPRPSPTLASISPASVDAGATAFTLTVTGSGFVRSSYIQWGNSWVTTTFVDSSTLTATLQSYDVATPHTVAVTVVTPAPGGGTSAAQTFTVRRPDQAGVTVIGLKANDLAWDPYQRRIYASVPSGAALNPNTVTAIDPYTGQVTGAVFVGSEPDRMSVSDDGQYLYVALRGASSVERLTLPALAHDLGIVMGRDATNGAYYANDLRVAPGAPRTLAVARLTSGSAGSSGGLVVFDDATPRATVAVASYGYGYGSLQWGTTASELFATPASYGYELYTFSVDASGVTTENVWRNALSSSGGLEIRFDPGTGLLYSEDGRATDPATGLLAGTFPPLSGSYSYYGRRVVPDSSLGSAFFVTGDPYSSSSGSATVSVYDLWQYYPVRSATLAYVGAPPRRLIRWGVDGLAFVTPESVVLLRGATVLPQSSSANPVPTIAAVSPATASAGGPNLALTVTGAGFVRGAIVLWNGSERATTYVSETRLVAYVPAQDLAAAGSAEVTVANPTPGGGTSAAAAFTVGP